MNNCGLVALRIRASYKDLSVQGKKILDVLILGFQSTSLYSLGNASFGSEEKSCYPNVCKIVKL